MLSFFKNRKINLPKIKQDVGRVRATVHFEDGTTIEVQFNGEPNYHATDMLNDCLTNFSTVPGSFIVSTNNGYYPNYTNKIKKVQVMEIASHIIEV